MKPLSRRLLSALLMAALLCIPFVYAAADDTDFIFDPLSGTITGYLGQGGEVMIPSTINGLPVTAIGDHAFNSNREITAVSLPEGLKRLGHGAFYFCDNLLSIELPQSLEVIMPYALFANESLTSLTIPAAVSYIGNNAVFGCLNLSDIRFLGEPPLIGKEAFDHPLQERQYTVPSEDQAAYEALLAAPVLAGGARVSVDRTIPENDFEFDPASGTVKAYKGDAAYIIVPETIAGIKVSAIGDQAFFGNKVPIRMDLPMGLERIGEQAFYASSLVDIRLPESLKTIGNKSFAASRLIQLALPEGLESIGEEAFASNAFESLTLPEGITALPPRAFARNSSLNTVYLPASLQNIGDEAFADCDRLDYLVFAGRTMPLMGEGVFTNCPIDDIDIAWDADRQQVQEAQAVFSSAGLAMDRLSIWRANRTDEPPYPFDVEFTFDDTDGAVTSYLGAQEEMTMYWTFWGNDGELHDVRALGAGLFESSNLRRFFVPHSDQLAIIGDRAFADSQLEEIYLFDSVTDIGAAAFRGCENLASIVIPPSVQRIGPGAFENCVSLTEVIFLGGAPLIEADAFKGCAALTSLTLPAGARLTGTLGIDPGMITVSADAEDEQLRAMADALELPWYITLRRAGEPDTFAAMPDTANAEADFEFDAQTRAVTKYIGSSAEVVVPRSIGGLPVERIASLAFSDASVFSYLSDTAGRTGLTSVVLPETVYFIDDSAFLESRSLKSFTCYGPVQRLGIRAFENCVALEDVSFVNGVREIDFYAFNFNESLSELNLGDHLARIGEGAFNGCKNIKTFRVTASVTSVETGVFQGMDSLKAIYFDRPDADILGFGNFQFSDNAAAFELCLPESASDEEVAAFVSVLNQNLLPGKEMVVRKNFK